MIEHITQEFLDSIRLPDPAGKKLNYLMVMPQIAENDGITYMIPYGFCLVASALKASGRSVTALNLNYKKEPYKLVRRVIAENGIDVIATGGLSGQYAQLKKILDAAKAEKPDIITMVGGGIITADPVNAMKAFGNADYGMIGEGEITINDLAYAIETGGDATSVPGVVLRDGRMGPARKEIENLDMLPFPDYEGMELELLLQNDREAQSWFERNPVGITLSRSCPFQCTFCFHSSGQKYRRRSLDNVFLELDWIIRNWGQKRKLFFIVNDELFVSKLDYLRGFCERIAKYDVHYWIQTRVDTITKEILQLLKDSGCSVVSYGVENVDDGILRSMRKKITRAQIERAFDLANEVGIPAYGNILFGDPAETPESIENNLNWWKEHPEYNIYLINILTFPGTKLYKDACGSGLISDPVQYLIANETELNLTRIPDEEYKILTRRINLFETLVSCGADVSFSGMDMQFDVLRRNLGALSAEGKIAVWPMLYATANALDEIAPEFIANETVYFVNAEPRDTRLQGIERFNKPVYTPDIVRRENIETVLFAFPQRSGYARAKARITDMIRSRYPQVKRVIELSSLLRKPSGHDSEAHER